MITAEDIIFQAKNSTIPEKFLKASYSHWMKMLKYILEDKSMINFLCNYLILILQIKNMQAAQDLLAEITVDGNNSIEEWERILQGYDALIEDINRFTSNKLPVEFEQTVQQQKQQIQEAQLRVATKAQGYKNSLNERVVSIQQFLQESINDVTEKSSEITQEINDACGSIQVWQDVVRKSKGLSTLAEYTKAISTLEDYFQDQSNVNKMMILLFG